MKKIYFIIFLSLLSFYSHAQIAKNWVEVGIKGDVNFNYLLNTNIIEDVNTSSSYFSVGNFKGVKFGFNFNQSVGITVDILHSAMNQKYTNDVDLDSMNFEKKIHLNYVDIPVLFRTFTDVTYFEIGPQISFLVNAKETYTSNAPSPVLDYTNTDKNRFSPYNISAVIGFGTMIWGKNNLSLIIAFRAAYGFLDIIAEADRNNHNYPNNGGVGTKENYLSHQPFPAYNKKADVAGYKPTTGITGGFSLELNYNFLSVH